MTNVWLLASTLGVLVFLGAIEAFRQRRNLNRIPIRIHVNGTRGKSSVTRLIAAGLRAGGLCTAAKTTGTLPRLILPDGSELPINRPSRPNVIEQRDVVRAAAKLGVEAFVVECMALQPHLQWVCEGSLVRATHGVIINARADHLDVMGPTEKDVACALANMTPRQGKLFTAESKHLDVFRMAANDRRSTLIPVAPHEISAVSDTDMEGFSYVEHQENVALALRVCEDLGVPRDAALRGMWQCRPDPGATTTHEVDFFGRRLVFVNAFAANDPDSTARIWHKSSEEFDSVEQRIVVVNCRADRAERSHQFGRECAAWKSADHFIAMGTGTRAFVRSAIKAGVDPQRIVNIDDVDADELFETVVNLAGRSALVVGVGNIGNKGLEVVRYFHNRTVVEPVVPAVLHQRLQRLLQQHEESDYANAIRHRVLEAARSPNGNGNGHAGNGHITFEDTKHD